jgi:hypothetical protein
MFARLFRRSSLAYDMAAVDRVIAAELVEIDRQLKSWSQAINRPNPATDYLLDERLFHRPPDVMASVGGWGLAA